MPGTWIPDIETYNSIQKLKTFVNFVANTKYATGNDKQAAEKIIYLIENIDKPETYKNWMVCLDIFNTGPDYHHNGKHGIYWRQWWVTFENYSLEIEAKTNHTDEPLYHWGNDFEYFGDCNFEKDVTCNRVRLDQPIDSFVKDAINYEMYMNELMQDVQIDLEVSEI